MHRAEPTDLSLEIKRNMTQPVRRVQEECSVLVPKEANTIVEVPLLGHGGSQVGVMGVVPSMMECKEQKINMLVVMTNQGGSRDQWSISSERVELKLEYSELGMRVQVAINCSSLEANKIRYISS